MQRERSLLPPLPVIPAKAGIQCLGFGHSVEEHSFRPLRGRVTFFAGTKKVTKEMPARDVNSALANSVVSGFSDSPFPAAPEKSGPRLRRGRSSVRAPWRASRTSSPWLGRKTACIHARRPPGLQDCAARLGFSQQWQRKDVA